MSAILTTLYHRNKTLSDIASSRERESPTSDGIVYRPTRHDVFLSDFDESEQAILGECFDEISFDLTRRSAHVSIQLFLLLKKIFIEYLFLHRYFGFSRP